MFRRLLLTSAALLIVMGVNSEAKADPFTITQGQTINLTFASTQFPGTTATATVTLSGNQLIIQMTNTSTNGATIKTLGFDTTPSITATNVSFSGGMSHFQATSSGGPGGRFEFVAGTQGNRERTLDAGQTGSVTLTLSSVPTSLTFDRFLVHFTRLGANANDSEWLGPNQPPTEPIPEPMTMILLGTGLAGTAATVRRRRRKAQQEAEQE